jgi:HK97 family phage major capsid protein
MNSIQELRERRSAKATDARKLLDDNKGEKWTPEVSGKVDALYEEIDSIEGQIKAHQRLLDIEADKPDGNLNDAKRVKDVYDPKDPKNAARVLYNRFLREGDKGFSAEDWATVRATMSTTTGTEGGYTVPSLISSQLYDAMKAYGAMRAVSNVIPTQDGKPMSFPTSDGTAEIGEWIAQNVTATALDPVFGTVPLNVFKASSKIVAVPIELLQDTVIDMEGFVRNRLAQRIGRLGNLAFTVGTGTTQPDGVALKATVGKVGTTGQVTGIIYDDVVDMIHSVDPAYRTSSAVFMMSDALVKTVRKIKDTTGRPIWAPNYDEGIRTGAGDAGGGYTSQNVAVPFDLLLGYRLYINNDLAVPAANAKSGLFGDFSYYKIRDAMDVQLFRFTDSAYTKLGQVGFLGWCRMGGNLMDTNAIKYYQNSAT